MPPYRETNKQSATTGQHKRWKNNNIHPSTHIHTDTDTDRQTDRQTDTHRQTDRQTDTHQSIRVALFRSVLHSPSMMNLVVSRPT